MHVAKWAIVLSAFWLLLSGFIDQPLLLSFGAISVAIVVYILMRMDHIDQEPRQVSTGLKLFQYLLWLFGQIVISSIQVTKLVWGSSDKVSPALAKIDAKNISPKNRVLYANSITLTPGTLSVDLVEGEITVHALQASSIEELKQGEMERKITGIWGADK